MKSKISHLFLFLTLALLIGCSPKTGSGVLSFFFDGVPDPAKKEELARIDSVKQQDTSALNAALLAGKGVVLTVHAPYQKRECAACHDNSAATSIVSQSQNSMCYKCHTSYADKYKFQHGPVAGGYCTACHAPHESEIPKLLKRNGQQLCLLCHTTESVLQNKVHANIGDTDCTKCHNPHGGTNKSLLQ